MTIEPTLQKLATRVFEISPYAINELNFCALRKLMRKAGALKAGDTVKIGDKIYDQAWFQKHLRLRENKNAGLINTLTSSTRVWLHKILGRLPLAGRLFRLPPRPVNAQDVKALMEKPVAKSAADAIPLTEKELNALVERVTDLPGMNQELGEQIGKYLDDHNRSRAAAANVIEFIRQFERKKIKMGKPNWWEIFTDVSLNSLFPGV